MIRENHSELWKLLETRPLECYLMPLKQELDVALRLAAQAGALALHYQRHGFIEEEKLDASPVTVADRQSEAFIVRELTELYPGDSILGEEGTQVQGRSGRRWIIDPLDGTRDFVRGNDNWAVLLALEQDDDVVLGVCHMPALGKTYWAVRGEGSYCNGQKIQVSQIDTPAKAVLCLNALNKFSRYIFKDKLVEWSAQFWAVRSLGGCMDAMQVASGRAEIYLEPELKPWDLAALKVIVEEAGGLFFNFDGGSSIYGKNAVLCTPGLRKAVEELLSN